MSKPHRKRQHRAGVFYVGEKEKHRAYEVVQVVPTLQGWSSGGLVFDQPEHSYISKLN